jgi:hypothetical protein
MTNQFSFNPVSDWLQNTPVFSPTDIQYHDLPVSPQNARPQTLMNNFIVQNLILALQILIHPEILAIVVLLFAVLITISLIPRRRRATKADS